MSIAEKYGSTLVDCGSTTEEYGSIPEEFFHEN